MARRLGAGAAGPTGACAVSAMPTAPAGSPESSVNFHVAHPASRRPRRAARVEERGESHPRPVVPLPTRPARRACSHAMPGSTLGAPTVLTTRMAKLSGRAPPTARLPGRRGQPDSACGSWDKAGPDRGEGRPEPKGAYRKYFPGSVRLLGYGTSMVNFVLVAGARLGAWAWDEVAPYLRAAGHGVYPLTLSGLADKRGVPAGQATHVQDIVSEVERRGLRDVVLVGHSYSGIPVGQAAERIGDRLTRAVFVDSNVPTDGESFVSAWPDGGAAVKAKIAENGGVLAARAGFSLRWRGSH